MLKKMYLPILVCMIGLFLIGCKQEVSMEVDFKNIKNAIDSDGGTFYTPMEFVFEVADMDSFKQEEEYVQFLLSKAFPRGISDFEYFTKDSTTYVKIQTEIPVYVPVSVDHINTWIKESKNSLFSLSYFDNILSLDMTKKKYKKFKNSWENHFIFQSGINITEMFVYVYVTNTTKKQEPKVQIMPNFIDGEARIHPKKQKLEHREYITILMSDVSLYYLREHEGVEIMSFEGMENISFEEEEEEK